MECHNQHIRELLPDYFTRHLSTDEMKSVCEHLNDCSSCQERLGVMESLNGRYASPAGCETRYHPTDEVLGKYYEHREALDTQTKKRIEQHLADCQECANSLAFLTNLEVALVQSIVETDSNSSPALSFLDLLAAFVRRPALAYLLILLMAYPAIRWISSPGISTTQIGPTSYRVFVIKEQTRSSNSLPQVLRQSGDEIVQLKIPFYHILDDNHYTVTIAPAKGDPWLATEFILDFSDKGAINIILSTREMNDGTYLLNLTESKRNGTETGSVSRYSFELISQ